MDPISTGLAGIALVQKSVELIKSNINTVNDIRDIAGALDGLFEGEKQVQKKRFNDKSIIGQSKDAAHSVIDAKLAQEQLNLCLWDPLVILTFPRRTILFVLILF